MGNALKSTYMAKRILYFIPEFPRLTETFIEREVSALIKRGNLDVTVLSLKRANGSTTQDVLGRTFYRRLTVMDCIKAIRLVFKVIPRGNLFLFLKAVGYAQIISEYKPDHIHVHFLSNISTLIMYVSKILNVPFSVSAHARDIFVDGEFIQQKIVAAKFITVCNNKAFESIHATNKNVYRIYHGIDPEILDVALQIIKPARPVIFLGGTRLVEKKGLEYMLEASKLLVSKGFDHEVHIVGPGPLYVSLTTKIKELGLENTVYIHGEGKGTPFAQVIQYYKLADVFVYPAIDTTEGDVDGIPTVVIEAALAKLPIVTTNAGSISDLIDTSNGVIIPQKDAKAISVAIELLLGDNELAHKNTLAAYDKAAKMFDATANIGELEKHLLE